LLEHLLFEDEAIAYDARLQAVGGSTNAYTSQDYTVYYARVPREAASLALELEAARLFNLRITEEKVAIQRQVVAEEFRQRYLNPPYADKFFWLSQAAFRGHPYQTMVIGETPEQVLALPYEGVRAFYEAYYVPEHAVLCVAGGIEETIEAQIHSLFGGHKVGKPLPEVPSLEGLPSPQPFIQREGAVPQIAVLWAFRLPPLEHPDMPAVDILDDFLGDPEAGYLVRQLVHKQGVASRLSTYVWSLHQGGLWVIEAYLPAGIAPERYEAALEEVLEGLRGASLAEALAVYRPQRYYEVLAQREKVLGRALALIHAVLAGHLEWYEDPLAPYEVLTPETLQAVTQKYLVPERRVRLYYLPSKAGATG
jgi:predicted Zn-dependent peptidase